MDRQQKIAVIREALTEEQLKMLCSVIQGTHPRYLSDFCRHEPVSMMMERLVQEFRGETDCHN